MAYSSTRGAAVEAPTRLEWACGVQTPLGLLPEQVHAVGSPAWVLPLTWSHAMLVLAVRPELSMVSTALERRGVPTSHPA